MIDPFFTYLSIIVLVVIFAGKVLNLMKNIKGEELYPKEMVFVLFAISIIMWFFLFTSFTNNLAYESTYQIQDPEGEYNIVAQDNYGVLSATTHFQMGTLLFAVIAFISAIEMFLILPRSLKIRERKNIERGRAG